MRIIILTLIILSAVALFFLTHVRDSSFTASVAINKEENKQAFESKAVPLEDMAGKLIIVGFRGTDVSENPEIHKLLTEVKPGGVILFDRDLPSGNTFPRNIISPTQLKQLTGDLNNIAPYPLLIAVDAEGGRVNRLSSQYGFVEIPSHYSLGAGQTDNTYKTALILAKELKDSGININFAPVVDIYDTESPAIGALGRSFSSNTSDIVDHAKAFIQAHEEVGVIPTLKHFPGHGHAYGDTHKGVVDVTSSWMPEELTPYEILINDGYKAPIMTAHVVNRNISQLPATLSSKYITDILRNELNFTGVIISDDLHMKAISEQYGVERAAVMAIKAGVDMVIISNNIGSYDPNAALRAKNAIIESVESGEISQQRVEESYQRIENLTKQYANSQ